MVQLIRSFLVSKMGQYDVIRGWNFLHVPPLYSIVGIGCYEGSVYIERGEFMRETWGSMGFRQIWV